MGDLVNKGLHHYQVTSLGPLTSSHKPVRPAYLIVSPVMRVKGAQGRNGKNRVLTAGYSLADWGQEDKTLLLSLVLFHFP